MWSQCKFGTPANFNGFRVLAVLLHGSLLVESSKLCGVEQRAPPIFGRAAITLGIGPHSSLKQTDSQNEIAFNLKFIYRRLKENKFQPLSMQASIFGACPKLG